MNEILILSGLIFVLGTIVGSFLNVCIVRMPHELSVVKPRSHCPQCKKMIAWYDNIPLLSYLILGGKCRHCKEKFSMRYFGVELLTGITFVLFYRYFGLQSVLLPYLFMVSCFIVTVFVDFEHRIIPDEISVGGMYFGLIFSLFIPNLHGIEVISSTLAFSSLISIVLSVITVAVFSGLLFCLSNFVCSFFTKEAKEEFDIFLFSLLGFYIILKLIVWKCATLPVFYEMAYPQGVDVVSITLGLIYSLFIPECVQSIPYGTYYAVPWLQSFGLSALGVVVGGGSIYGMGLLGDFLFKKETMGGGDVKILAMMGAFLGWKYAVLTFFLAPFFGALNGVISMLRTKDNTIAYGPFLVLGSLICLFKGEELLQWIMSGYGLY